ncbi:MAG: sigma-70 family RNA polymerase sigma factor [Solirubrobacteraceae bacterium]|nr:sigma-70 family RNA polymerase sigma factor [Patulibacter sp.]
MASPGPSDAQLLCDRLAPAESFSQFYRRHLPRILKFCARYGLSAHDAADATSEIFIAAMCARYRFDPSLGDTATPWLYAIAKNVLNGQHRKSQRERHAYAQLHRQPIDLTERDLAEYSELRREVEHALTLIADLPADQRAAVIGRHLDDAEYIELAEKHGVSEAVVRQRVSRALSTVRERMGSRS